MAVALPPALAQEVPADLPVLSRQVTPGLWSAEETGTTTPSNHTVDGDISDWIGTAPGFAGVALYSAGELIYQDHLFDAYGPDDGVDAERLETNDALADAVSEAYRIESIYQADIPGELGVPAPDGLSAEGHYGDMDRRDEADLLEFRIARDGDSLAFLARTTTMTASGNAGLLVLFDTIDGGEVREVPFASGLTTAVAETALFVSGDSGAVADLTSGEITPLPPGSVASDPAGYLNAIEAEIPASLVGADGDLSVAAATGTAAGDAFAESGLASNVANVAFRMEEPVREWFDKRQALSLLEGTIDPFFTEIDDGALSSGRDETFVPGPGYHERIFISSPEVARETGKDGKFQHYGVYLPAAYDPSTPNPLQYWFHWRGGEAHTAAALAPRIFKHFGEDQDTVVVSPSGRGTSTWYVGRGHVDANDVWEDVLETFNVDENRVYITGHSMGGWATYLMTILYPDRFAAGLPVAGPVTQGAWTGADFPGCDSMQFQEYTPCYISANGSNPRAQHTRRLLENLRHVPLGIFQGAIDELVPVGGVTRQVERLAQLGYEYRYYLFPNHEHYTHPIMDEWAEGARYMHSQVRDPNPARVTYIRDMPFETATETVQSNGIPLDFSFDSAYWMSGLTPADPVNGVARFDGRSLAIAQPEQITAPEAGGPASLGQSGPYLMSGLTWLEIPGLLGTPETSNAFELTLSGAAAVSLDLGRMAIDTSAPLIGSVVTDGPLTLTLTGVWSTVPTVTGAESATLDGDDLKVVLPAGSNSLTITP